MSGSVSGQRASGSGGSVGGGGGGSVELREIARRTRDAGRRLANLPASVWGEFDFIILFCFFNSIFIRWCNKAVFRVTY